MVIITGLLCLFFIWWNLSISNKIIKYLKIKGEEVSLFNDGFFIGGKIFKYLPLYKKTTLENDGKVGRLYSKFYLTFFIYLVLLIIGIIMVF